MKKLILSAVCLLALVTTASAKQEVQVTRTVWEITDFPDLAAKVKAVCEGKATLSDKLKDACKEASKLPKVTKAGAFRNTGTGAELNALIRQVEPAKASEAK